MEDPVSISTVLKDKFFRSFIETAKEYCSLIESDKIADSDQFIRSLQRILPYLYYTALNIPNIKLEFNEESNIEIPKHKMDIILQNISNKVPFFYYWVMLNPIDESNTAQTGTGDLIDDLSDIYKDLKRYILLFENENIVTKEEAVWQFRFSFINHWAEHCVEALSAIHHYIRENDL